ncbi:gp93 [Synechococcus phage syn9]|jgi:hypothetical protein|uniref:Gp93 n=1 Tax=Synechococcus phage syn9 TaxID=382359 RepID=Q0QZD5_BPSYS|nr:gp93 [Synechococcus phage syn9]ABA47062.1 gp93 [Synechococcus phage syn9]AGH56579.1 hypothetical protein CPUG_00087 [Cyanophage Syn10]
MALKDDLELLANDNATAHEALNECIGTIAEQLKGIKDYVTHLTTPDKILYKPKGEGEYLTLKENLDLIYAKLHSLEEKVNGC